jgi:predicted GNAT family N-acyltransferase
LKKLSITELDFGLLDPGDDITKLDCTEEDKSDPLQVNEFIHNYARAAHDSKLTTVYTVKHKKNLIACFTVSMFVIKAKKLANEEQVKDLPINSYPAILLGQMCVDKGHRGRDIGKHMCTFALGIASNVSKRVGCMCLVLHTTETKSEYYKKYCGFTKAKVDPKDRSTWMYKRII